ncbi:MAG: amidase [Gemmatimonadaceae bacterium]|nr:amidase [Gemmatimonadaceae bacterium]
MAPTRREALAQLSALFALPLADWSQPPTDPLRGTIAEYQAGRVMRRYSAEEVTTEALARCRTRGTQLHAIDQLASTAIAEARESDARRARGALRGALDGVPVFAKSIYDMAGLPTTASSATWARLFPQPVARDALEVQRLRAAGAVLLGKTAADDFAYRGNGTSSLTGQVHNPHDPTGVYTPGGSSAGAAVVVACGMAFAALGTDDGGSNRIPAQFTGVVGMKPTFGVIPRTGVVPTWPYLDTHGPLARTVADAAALYAALVGPDTSDGLALSTRGALPVLRDDALTGVRLGAVETHVPRAQMSSETLAAFDRALTDCAAAGAIVERFTPSITRATVRDAFQRAATARGDVAPNANAPAPTANALLRYFESQMATDAQPRERAMEAVLSGLDAFRAFYDVLPADPAAMAILATQPYERDPAGQSFARSRREIIDELAASMKAARIDVMIYPTMPFGAPRAVDAWPDVRTPLGYGNMLGVPEVSVPAGYAANGMPVCNLSFVGIPGDDARVLACAHAYERRSQRFIVPPSAR